MSCIIYLIRHGIAGDAPAGMSDADRSLTPAGVRKMTKIAAALKRLHVTPDVIFSSPLLRAKQTADSVAAVLTPNQTVQIYTPLAPGNQVSDVVDGLGRRRRTVMLVGHQPDLGQLASFLLTRSVRQAPLPFKKGGVAAIEVDALPPHTGSLLWFLTPKQLRLMAT